ncbi:hypothetical protein MMC07_001202 [Pseudocyphellaria aurata]|nr:hypothetical protein [Pseudocyphellaria aurata]
MSDDLGSNRNFINYRGRGEGEGRSLRGRVEGEGEGRGWRGRGRGRGLGSSRGGRRGYRARGSNFGQRPDPTLQWQTQGELLDTVDLGSPPRWAPLATPRKLEQDSGEVYRDQNAARYPKHPYEPGIRAILTMQPQFHSSKIDVVACGSTIGNLLRYARSMDMSFRFDVDFIGNSVFFVRKENSPKEVIEGLYGHGHTFPEAYTNWEEDVRGSVSHQRIVRYTFGGLSYLIRTEGDGWLPERLTSEELASAKPDPGPTKADDDFASLIQAAESVSVSQKTPTTDDALEIQLRGRTIPQKAVFDLKTRADNRKFDMADILPRLWVNQTPNFIIGYHHFGLFTDIQVRTVHDAIREWQEHNQEALRSLSAVVHRIIHLARSSKGHGGLEVSRIGSGDLMVRRLLDHDWHALPSDLRHRWAGRSDENVESKS